MNAAYLCKNAHLQNKYNSHAEPHPIQKKNFSEMLFATKTWKQEYFTCSWKLHL